MGTKIYTATDALVGMPIPAIVESEHAQAMAQVRSLASALREADAQLEKAEKKFDDADRVRTRQRETQARIRLELGRALIEVHRSMKIKQGDRSGRWAKFLEKSGIEPRTAANYMRLAGHVESTSETEESVSEVPTYAEAGLDLRPRKSDEPTFDPDDVTPLPDAPLTPLDRTGGRGKPQWLMQALISDYSRPQDLICDPLAGFGSTLIAAGATNRRAIGCEIDPAIVEQCGVPDIQIGDYRTALSSAGNVDAIITDPPYSDRTHTASRKFGNEREDGSPIDGLGPEYAAWNRDNVFEFVRHWHERCRGWIVALTDHHLIPHWQAAYEDVGRYSFAPVGVVILGMTVRLCGDGPSSWLLYAMVGRPQSLSRWGTLPGAYVGTRDRRLSTKELAA